MTYVKSHIRRTKKGKKTIVKGYNTKRKSRPIEDLREDVDQTARELDVLSDRAERLRRWRAKAHLRKATTETSSAWDTL